MTSKVHRPGHGVVLFLDSDGYGVVEAAPSVHIPGTIVGERIDYTRLTRIRKRWIGRLDRVVEASPQRVEPPCPHFGVCGGCSMQHLSPQAQIAHKIARVMGLMQAAGVEPAAVGEPILGPTVGYRRRARLGVRRVEGKGRVLVGFRELDARKVADVQRCPILAGDAAKLPALLAEFIDTLSVSRRLPQVEVTVADEGVALVFRVLDPLTPDDVERLRAFEIMAGVRIFLQPEGLESVVPLDGASPWLHSRLEGHEVVLEFAPTDFLQVNAAINQKLIDAVIERLDPQPRDRVLDLFCGLGNFSLPIARRAGAVLGIDFDAGLIARAQANARVNEIGSATFAAANLYDPNFSWPGAFDLVLLDPPRSGVGAALKQFVAPEIRRIVYVSCGPESLARDAAGLVQLGYSFRELRVADMFPHTAHVECLAWFER